MEKFFIRLLCFFIPVKSWRKKIRKKFGEKRELKEIFFEIKQKKTDLLHNPSKVEDLFIGSSHIDHGIIPTFFGDAAFNVGSNSQDLRSSYYIYKSLCAQCPNLKNIILGYSVFSPGLDVAKTSRAYIFDILHHHFSFPNHTPINQKYVRQFATWDRATVKRVEGRNGYLNPAPLKANNVEKRISTHLRENQRNNLQNEYIEKLAINVSKNQHHLYVVLMPARQEYIDLLPDKKTLFHDLFDITEKHRIPLLDYWNDPDFNKTDFSDFDHLNGVGAEKLTKKIQQDVKK